MKKGIGLLLALCLVFSLCTVPAHADGVAAFSRAVQPFLLYE